MTLADTPTTWPDPEPMSTLHGLLLFVGVPLLLFAAITLLVMAPSLAKGPRYRPGQPWDATPEWFGGPEGEAGDKQLTTGTGRDSGTTSTSGDDRGGASASW